MTTRRFSVKYMASVDCDVNLIESLAPQCVVFSGCSMVHEGSTESLLRQQYCHNCTYSPPQPSKELRHPFPFTNPLAKPSSKIFDSNLDLANDVSVATINFCNAQKYLH